MSCRNVDAIADTAVVCFTLKRSAFNKLLGPIEEVWKLEALRKVPILFNLSETQLKDLAARMKTMSAKADQIIFEEGDEGDCLPFTPHQASLLSFKVG